MVHAIGPHPGVSSKNEQMRPSRLRWPLYPIKDVSEVCHHAAQPSRPAAWKRARSRRRNLLPSEHCREHRLMPVYRSHWRHSRPRFWMHRQPCHLAMVEKKSPRVSNATCTLALCPSLRLHLQTSLHHTRGMDLSQAGTSPAATLATEPPLAYSEPICIPVPGIVAKIKRSV